MAGRVQLVFAYLRAYPVTTEIERQPHSVKSQSALMVQLQWSEKAPLYMLVLVTGRRIGAITSGWWSLSQILISYIIF